MFSPLPTKLLPDSTMCNTAGFLLGTGTLCLPFASKWFHRLFWVATVLLIILICYVVVFALFVFVLCLVPNFVCLSVLSIHD